MIVFILLHTKKSFQPFCYKYNVDIIELGENKWNRSLKIVLNINFIEQKTHLTILQTAYFSVEAICLLLSLQYSLTSSYPGVVYMTQKKWIRAVKYSPK